MELSQARSSLSDAERARLFALLDEWHLAAAKDDRAPLADARLQIQATLSGAAATRPFQTGKTATELRRAARWLETEGALTAAVLLLATAFRLSPSRTTEDAVLAVLARARLDRDLVSVSRGLLEAEQEPGRRGYLWATLTAALEETLGDHEAAAEAYGRAWAEFPEALEFLAGQARCLEALRRYPALLPVLEQQLAREDDPARLSLLHTRVASLLTSVAHDDVRAMHHYRQAIRYVPTFEPPVQGLLALAEKHRDWRTLVDALKLRLRNETRPRERAALFARLGEVISDRLGDPERARLFLERAVQEQPRALSPRVRLLELLCAQGEFARAEGYARPPEAADPRELDRALLARLCRLCAWVDRERGRPVHAARSLALGVEVDPEPRALLEEWLELLEQERPAEPPPQVLLRRLSDWKAQGQLGLATLGLRVAAEAAAGWGRVDDAERHLRHAIELAPGGALWKAYARLLHRARRHEEAVRAMLSAAAFGDANADRALVTAAEWTAEHLRDEPGALRLLQSRRAKGNPSSAALLLEAALALRVGELDGAEAALAALGESDEPRALGLRAVVARHRGAPSMLVEQLEERAASVGDPRSFREVVARRLAEGRPEATLTLLELAPTHRRGALLLPTAEALRAAGASAAAVAVYLRAAREGDHPAEALGALAHLAPGHAFTAAPEVLERVPFDLGALTVTSSLLASHGAGRAALWLYRMASTLAEGTTPPPASAEGVSLSETRVPADGLTRLLTVAEQRFGPLPVPTLLLGDCRIAPLTPGQEDRLRAAWGDRGALPRLLMHPAVGGEPLVLRLPLLAVVVSSRLLDPSFSEDAVLFAALRGLWSLGGGLSWLSALSTEQLEVTLDALREIRGQRPADAAPTEEEDGSRDARASPPPPTNEDSGGAASGRLGAKGAEEPSTPAARLSAALGGDEETWHALLVECAAAELPESVPFVRERVQAASFRAAIGLTGDLAVALEAASLLPVPRLGLRATRAQWLRQLARVPEATSALSALVAEARRGEEPRR